MRPPTSPAASKTCANLPRAQAERSGGEQVAEVDAAAHLRGPHAHGARTPQADTGA
ncbi:hypothetical protein JOD54_006420 [Actinokineospora baliensis]|uniref:hypothetical protein n=1 Tax=Actinokineospora baliensis TaxID=547056 RepID=UPI00195DEF9A|nr:hypothetical protein [Actinokineospora baliensis]MBM7776216.1 hypothetical protein [Actinokineospora baliensis]